MKHTSNKRRIGYLLGLVLLVVTVFAVMAVSASAATYKVDSQEALLALLGGGSYYELEEDGETLKDNGLGEPIEVHVDAAATLAAAGDTIQFTASFAISAVDSIVFPKNVTIACPSGSANRKTITRLVGGHPMFKVAEGNAWIQNIVLDGNNVADSTSDGGLLKVSGVLYMNSTDAYFQNAYAKTGAAVSAWGFSGSKYGKAYFENCHASENGGAMYLRSGFSQQTLIWTSGAVAPSFKNCTAGNYGGAIAINLAANSGGFNADKMTFTGCSAKNGGAFAVYSTNNSIDFSAMNGTLTNWVIGGATSDAGNTAENGGGIYLGVEMNLTLAGATIQNNVATGSGSAVYVSEGATLKLGNTAAVTVTGNTIGNNGGTISLDADLATGSAVDLAGGEDIVLNYTPADESITLGFFSVPAAEAGYAPTIEGGKIATPGATVILKGNLGEEFNFWFETIALLDASKRSELKAYFQGGEIGLTEHVALTPRELMDEITLKCGDDVLGTYTFAYYLELVAADPNYTEIANAALNYGTATQVYTGWNTDNLAKADYAAGLTEAVTGTQDYWIDAQDTAAQLYSAYISFDSKIVVNVTVKDWTDKTYTVYQNYGETNEADITANVQVNGTDAVISTNGILAGELLNDFSVTIDDGTNYATVYYNLLDYILFVEANSADANLKTLVRALYAYAEAAANLVA